ncbi:MAG: hypothetical protein RIS46_629, partial [Actinomycetota bacterium]
SSPITNPAKRACKLYGIDATPLRSATRIRFAARIAIDPSENSSDTERTVIRPTTCVMRPYLLYGPVVFAHVPSTTTRSPAKRFARCAPDAPCAMTRYRFPLSCNTTPTPLPTHVGSVRTIAVPEQGPSITEVACHADAPPTSPTAPTTQMVTNDTRQRLYLHQYAHAITQIM